MIEGVDLKIMVTENRICRRFKDKKNDVDLKTNDRRCKFEDVVTDDRRCRF